MAEKITLTKQDRKKVWWRHQFLQGSWNYEPYAKWWMVLFNHSCNQEIIF